MGSADELIAARIAEAQAALWRAELIQSLLIPVVTGILFVTAWAMLEQWLWAPNRIVRCIVWLTAVVAAYAWIRYRIWPLFSKQVRPEYAAYSLEHDAPSLRHALTSYVTLRDDQSQAGVRGMVVRSIGTRAAGQLRQLELESPSEAAVRMSWWLALAVAIAFAAAYLAFSPRNVVQSTKRLLVPIAALDAPRRVVIQQVLPGDTEVLATQPFEVAATIEGLRDSETARVQWGVGFSQQLPMQWQADTGRYVANVRVDQSTSYRVVAGDATAGPYSINAKSLPVASVEQVEVVPPNYTELPPRITRGGPIVAEANSQVRITGNSTLPLSRARIEFNPVDVGGRVQAAGGVLDLKIADDGLSFSGDFVLADLAAKGTPNRTAYRIHVWTPSDHENPDPVVYPIRLIDDLRPEISIASPKRAEVELPINGTLPIEIHAADPDYRLKQIDVQIKRGIDTVWAEPVWSSDRGQRGHQTIVWMFEPETVRANVGDRFELVAVAMDNHHDAAGKLASGQTATNPLVIKITKADPAGRVGPQGKQPEQGTPDGKSSNKGEPGQEAGGSGQGQPSGQSAAGGSGDEATSEEQGGEGGSGGESSKQPGNESGSSEGSGEGQSEPDQANNSGSNQAESGSGQSQSGAGPSESEPTDGSMEQGASNPNEGEQNQGRQNPSNQNSGKPGNDSRGEQNAAPENMAAGDGTTGNDGKGTASDQANPLSSGSEQTGAGQGASQPSPSQGTPQPPKPTHDGEAFERIREFIENQKADNNSTSPAAAEPGKQGETNAMNDKADANQSDTNQSKPAQPESNQAGANQPKPTDESPTAPNQPPQGEQGGEQGQAGTGSSEPHGDDAAPQAQGMKPNPGGKPTADNSALPDNPTQSAREQTPAESPAGRDGEAAAQLNPAAGTPEGGNSDQTQSDPNGRPGDNSQGAGKPESGKPESGKPESGKPESGKPESGKPESGKPESGKPESGKPSGESQSGDQQPGQPQGSDQPQDAAQPQDSGNPNDKPGPGAADAGQPRPGNAGNDAQNAPPKSEQAKSEQAKSQPPNGQQPSGQPPTDPAAGQNQDGAGNARGDNAAGGAGEGGPENRPPDPVNADYAREATDLVLKYLNQNRDALPPELLERLNWTPQELNEFADRWSRLRNQEATGTADRQTVDEALRSLGLRKPVDGAIGRRREHSDQLQGLKDAGNRNAAPAVHRDAFDAFRRNYGRQ